ncbi:MAG: hypothetical protein SGPRY_014550 [Prymnesium sp.]
MAEESDARERGNAAFKAGENEKAVECFTQAIASDPSSHLLYSNRSAAYARLGQFTPALLDANKAIELKPDWFKGHSRRAAAYMGLRSWRPALAAFEEGLRLEPNNAYMLEESARIKKLLEGGNAPSSSTPASNGRSSINNKMHGVLSLNVLLFSFFYVRVLPLMGNAMMCYRISLALSMSLLLNSLRSTWPLSLSTIKNPAFLQSEEMQAPTIDHPHHFF